MAIASHNPSIPLFPNAGADKCSRCTALCCRYFGLEIDTPEDERDFDKLVWFMVHKQVELYVEDGKWHLNILSECQHLLPDNRCGIYENRPYICRDYDTDGCEFETVITFDHHFRSPDELIGYMRARGIPGAYLQPGEILTPTLAMEVPKKKKRRRPGSTSGRARPTKIHADEMVTPE